MQQKLILIVEDEAKIAEAVEAYLNKRGYNTAIAGDGRDALDKFAALCPDMLILDLNLPLVSGEDVCREIRKKSRIPIIMLTAKSLEDDKVNGLVMGADDYMTKPFSPRELVARVDSLFRRCSDGISPAFNYISFNKGDLILDYDSYTVSKAGQPANLTPNEYKILSTLVKYPNKTYTRDELIDIAFGIDFVGNERTIDSHIKNLRAKIENDTTTPQYILTVRGIGYKFGGSKD